MRKLYKITAMMMICFFIAHSAFADVKSVTVDGFCYLEGTGDHSGTKVLFTAVSPSAQTDSTYTNANGSYFAGLTEGIYTVHYSHDGYQPYTIPGELGIFVNTTLDDVTLSPGIVVEVSGPQSGVWSSGNLYQVIGNISVSSGETLVIEPGVTVKFMDYYSFIINGKLAAEGTVNDSIYFTSGLAVPEPGSWDGIHFINSSSVDNVICYSVIEFAVTGISFENSASMISHNRICRNSNNGIYCSTSAPNISYNDIIYNGSTEWDHSGINCTQGSSPIIDHNTIVNNFNVGIQVNNSSPLISNNLIGYSEDYSIWIRSSSMPTIISNTITYSWRGIFVDHSTPYIIMNQLYYNTIGIRLWGSSCELINNTICLNEEGVTCYIDATPSIINNVFNENITGLFFESEPSTLSYNSFWQNNSNATGDFTPPSFGEIVTVNLNGDPCDPYLNLFMDPLFIDPGNLDFHITEGSPCIDAGNPDPAYYDPDGTIADIGAFYYDQTILAPVIIDILAEPTEGVAPLFVQFSSEITGQVTTYNWSFGDGGTSTLPNPIHTYSEPGSYRLRLSVTGPGGTTTMSKPEYITVFDPLLIPNADFSAQPLSGFVPLVVEFMDLSVGEVDSLFWDFGDGVTSTETNPIHEYQNTGLFSVSLTAYNTYGYDSETKAEYIEVLEQMEVTAAFEVSGDYGCSPFTVTFTNQSTGSIDSYLWDFGDGELSTEENPVHTFTGADEYIVILTVTGSLNTDMAVDTITVELAEPFITSIEDRPNDQGGYVYLMFNKSFYDNVVPEDGAKSTEGYSFQRLDNETWVSLTYVYATGEENYTVELSTLADSTANSNGMSTFRVIAGMDEGTWISEPAEGYSVDNLAPATPQDLEGSFAGGQIELQWQPCPDNDFQYFAIYKTDENGLFGEEPFATTISNEITDVAGIADCSYKVSAFDFNGNQSPASETLTAQSVQIVSGWISLSAYVVPSYPEMENILAGINNELIIIQNMTGAYWPAQNTNTLGSWDNNSGYFIKSVSDVTFPIIGKKVDNNSLDLNAGWNLIPVLSECPVEIIELFNGIDVVIIKEVAGTNIYWPANGINTLDALEPGNAYFVLMNDAGTVIFPECMGE